VQFFSASASRRKDLIAIVDSASIPDNALPRHGSGCGHKAIFMSLSAAPPPATSAAVTEAHP
jgi:hypothetical protein